MLNITELCQKIIEGKYELSIHALRRIAERNISREEIRQSAANSKLIEDYPEDKYGPSSLLLGWTVNKRPIHLHVSRLENILVKIITLYQPIIDEWENNFTQRKR